MLFRVLCVIAFLCAAPEPAPAASQFVSVGNCALIVASRRTLREVGEFRRDNPQIPNGPVFQSKNGWFAISAGEILEAESELRIRRMVDRGRIPADSYCSDGSYYVAVVGRETYGGASSPPVQHGFNDEFDARPMTFKEKRLLQAALALQGHYLGVIDGKWGRGSQGAMEGYSLSEFGEEPTNAHAAVALLVAAKELTSGDWRPQTFPTVGVSMLLPMARISAQEVNQTSFRVSDDQDGAFLRIAATPFGVMREMHEQGGSSYGANREPYRLRKEDLWVTSFEKDGVRTYIRSRYLPTRGHWATVAIFYSPESVGAGLIISSLADSPVAPLEVDEGGYIDTNVGKLLALLEEDDQTAKQPSPRQATHSEPPHEPVAGSGTGFVVSPDGTILTNAHVVEGCGRVLADGRPVKVEFADENFDLAALTGGGSGRPWLSFSESPARLNSDVTIAGFPLHGILGGLSVTRGAISGLKGVGGDNLSLQISAPVQPGNSGGPVVDRYGRVVGVVVARLDAVAVADLVGSLPENVNFAVRGEIAKLFLSANGVRIATAPAAKQLDGVDLADKLAAATVLIECEAR